MVAKAFVACLQRITELEERVAELERFDARNLDDRRPSIGSKILRVTLSMQQEMARMFKDGQHNLSAIGRAHGVSGQTVRNQLKKAGVLR